MGDLLDEPAIALRPSTSDSNRLSLLFRRTIAFFPPQALNTPVPRWLTVRCSITQILHFWRQLSQLHQNEEFCCG
ncbi:hypothetical protein AB0I53_47835 [Saccharopolyspora sp. NPDC050389]|uniref:hypothetical protein n=1 Tax=Saccharopolyspora sp. NPDC050389 TaxID=3155516 RepID=UPI0033CC864C